MEVIHRNYWTFLGKVRRNTLRQKAEIPKKVSSFSIFKKWSTMSNQTKKNEILSFSHESRVSMYFQKWDPVLWKKRNPDCKKANSLRVSKEK